MDNNIGRFQIENIKKNKLSLKEIVEFGQFLEKRVAGDLTLEGPVHAFLLHYRSVFNGRNLNTDRVYLEAFEGHYAAMKSIFKQLEEIEDIEEMLSEHERKIISVVRENYDYAEKKVKYNLDLIKQQSKPKNGIARIIKLFSTPPADSPSDSE